MFFPGKARANEVSPQTGLLGQANLGARWGAMGLGDGQGRSRLVCSGLFDLCLFCLFCCLRFI